MKKLLIVWSAAILAVQVHASGLGIYGSYWNSKDYSDTLGGGLKLKLDMAPTFSMELRGSYLPEFAKDQADLDVGAIEAGLTFNLILNEYITPYIGGGAGYYVFDVKSKLDEEVEFKVDNKVGFYGVAGLELALSKRVAFFGEAKYTIVEAELEAAWENLDNVIKDTDKGKDLNGMGVNAGIVMKW